MRKMLICMLAATTVAATACGGDSSTGPSASVAGTYNLQTVDSKPLPFLAYDDGIQKIEVTSDSYTLAQDGTYTNQTLIRTTESGVATTDTSSFHGTYTQSGNSVTLTDSDDPTDKVTAIINGSTFTINIQGLLLVYQRS